MIARIITLLLLTGGLARGQSPVQFAKSDRILTIESWSHREAKVWAVQKTQIVIYTQSDFLNHTDQVALTKPISASQAQAIQRAIEALPKDAFGFHYFGMTMHAPLLRLHFTEDGSWDAHRIEASGQMPAWAKPLLDAVSAACPPEWRVDFEDTTSTYLREWHSQDPLPEVRKIGIREFYGEKRSWWEFWK